MYWRTCTLIFCKILDPCTLYLTRICVTLLIALVIYSVNNHSFGISHHCPILLLFVILIRVRTIWEYTFSLKQFVFIFLEFQVEFDAEGKVVGVTSEGETAKCKKVVCDPSYLPNKVIIENNLYSDYFKPVQVIVRLKICLLLLKMFLSHFFLKEVCPSYCWWQNKNSGICWTYFYH